MFDAIVVPLVRLKSDGYSVPVGTLGVIREHLERLDTETERFYEVSWLGPLYEGGSVVESSVPTPGGASLPVAGSDLEPLGELAVAVPTARAAAAS